MGFIKKSIIKSKGDLKDIKTKAKSLKRTSILKSNTVIYLKEEKPKQKQELNKQVLKEEQSSSEVAPDNQVSKKKQSEDKARVAKKQSESKELTQRDIDRLYRKAERELLKAQREAQQIIAQAKSEAEKIINDAQEQKETILQEAESQKEEIIKAGHEELEKLKAEAVENGYKEGIEKAKAEFEQEKTEYAKQILDTINSIVEIKKDVIKSLEPEVVKLSIAIAEKIVKTQIEDKDNIILNMVKQHLDKLEASNKITIRVHKDDVNTLKENIAFITSSLDGIKAVEVQPDSKVEKGGCIIETDFGTIDANISTQFDTLKAVFSQVVKLDDN